MLRLKTAPRSDPDAEVPDASDIPLGRRKRGAFERFLPRAVDMLTDRVRVLRVVKQAYEKLWKNEGGMARAKTDLALLASLVQAWARGDYRDVPWRSLVYAVGALLYFISPIDLIPDFIAGLGFVDDVAVAIAVVKAIRKDLDRYAQWERKQVGPARAKR